MQKTELIKMFNKKRAWEVRALRKKWMDNLAKLQGWIDQVPGDPDIDFHWDGSPILVYPMDKKLITEHIVYFESMGFATKWVQDLTSTWPKIDFCRDGVTIRTSYWHAMKGTTCVQRVISKTLETYEKTVTEWVCPDALEEVVDELSS